jgi:mono/diheme cytochrome c family protein
MIIRRYSLQVFSVLMLGSMVMPGFAVEVELDEGAELYHDYCSVCHGDKGDGNSRAKGGLSTRPRDFTQAGLSKILTRETMINIVLHGVPGTAMTGWSTRLNRAQAEKIVDYVRNTYMSQSNNKGVSVSETGTVETLPATAELSMPSGLTGNPEKGKLFYNDNCATCHGVSGGGDGPRAYFIFPKPRNFLSKESRMRLNRVMLFNAIKYGVRGKEMPAWGKVLDDQQIANIAEYVFKEMIQKDNSAQTSKVRSPGETDIN